MNKEEIRAKVWLSIIAGGQGTRLFLFSNDNCPKQFCPINKDYTFIQATINRFLGVGIDPRHIVVITTNARQHELAIEQTGETYGLLSENILQISPNYGYAGAMLVAANHIKEIDADSVVIQTPADQYVDANDANFKDVINHAIDSAWHHPVIIGKRITDSGVAKELGNIIYPSVSADIYDIEDFLEKPSEDIIKKIMRERNTACNTGINLWKTESLGYIPENEIPTDVLINDILRPMGAKLMVGTFRWADLGTFEALFQYNAKRENAQVVQLSDPMKIAYKDCDNVLIYTDQSIEVDVHGAENVAVIAREINNEAYLMISSFDAIQEVAMAAKIHKQCPNSFREGLTIGGRNNGFTNIGGDKYHVIFIGVSGYKVISNIRKSGNGGFVVSYGV